MYATDGYASSVTTLAQVSLADDNVFGDDDGASQLGTVTGNVSDGYAVTLTVGIDTTTTPTSGGRSGGDGRPSGAAGRGGTPPAGAPSGPGGKLPSSTPTSS